MARRRPPWPGDHGNAGRAVPWHRHGRSPHLPGRPARRGRPAQPPPLRQPAGLRARAAAERRRRDHRAPGRASRARPAAIEPSESTGDGTLRVTDTGIGLTEAQVHELLATIGRSSKRDELGFARHEFLGQFGIGLLSCFLVADEIRVVDPARPAAPTVLLDRLRRRPLRGRAGRPTQRAEPGTTVTLRAAPRRRAAGSRRPRSPSWPACTASLLPVDGHGRRRRRITEPAAPPWERRRPASAGRR